jgi:hypothetical protein
MRRNSHPKKFMMTEGRIFICLVQLLTPSALFAQNTHPGPSSSPYVVDGLSLGARIDFGSSIYRSYQCTPSEQFPQFTRCQRTQKQQIVGSRRSVDSTSSFLHSPDGTAVYINRYIAPGAFDRNEFQSEINRLSSKFGERAHDMRMPQREGFPNAVIASWGKVELEQLDADAVSILASGQSPRKGLLIDYLGDLRRSAQLGLPIYSLNGGAGYLWSASIDRNAGGHLRFLTVDASAVIPTRTTQPPSGEGKETESATPDAELARVETEKVRVELPKDEIENVAVLESANTDADAVENVATARGATFVLIAFLIIVAVSLLLWRAKARARRRKVYSSKIQSLNSGTYPQGVHAPQGKLLDKSMASQDTSPEPIAESELEKKISRPPLSRLQPCSHCNREISLNDNFCMYCGASVASKFSDGSTRLCSSCRNQIGASDKFCRHCGASSVAVVAPSMNFSNEGDHKIIAKGARATRKRTARKKAIQPQAENSQPDGKNPDEGIGTTGHPALNEVPKESNTAVLKT